MECLFADLIKKKEFQKQIKPAVELGLPKEEEPEDLLLKEEICQNICIRTTYQKISVKL